MTIHANIVIVGAGIVGSALACRLAQADSKLSILVLEASTDFTTYDSESFDPRVVALSLGSIELLQSLGVWRDICGKACSYQSMFVWDGEGNGSIEFNSRDIHTEMLGCIVENSTVLTALRKQMLEHKNIQFLAPALVSSLILNEGLSDLSLQGGQRITGDFVVGADGAHSILRDLAGIKTNEWDYEHRAIVTTVRTQLAHQNTARQRFSHQGPLAFLPLQTPEGSKGREGRYCSIVWSLQESLVDEVMSLSDDQFCERLGATFEYNLGRIEYVDQRFAIPLRQRRALRYGVPGFALVGDAAHTIHPLAGQGVNLGLADVQSLSSELLRALTRSVSLRDPSIIKRYQRNRAPKNLAAMAAMEGFKQLFGHESHVAQVLRNRGMDWFDSKVWLKRLIAQGANF